jgi:hypothetical protein
MASFSGRSCYHGGMFPITSTRFRTAACIAATALLLACSPKYDWREIHSADANFTAMFPGKPASHSRPVNLNGTQVTMSMTAAEVDGVTFAVGSAVLADPTQAQTALLAMKTALTRNMAGTVRYDKPVATPANPGMTEIEVASPAGTGASSGAGGQPRLLVARFSARERRVYQLVVVGAEKDVSREQVDTFFSSFKPG